MLEDLQPYQKVRPCRIRSIINELDDKDKKIFLNALNDMNGYPTKYLARTMTERGIMLSDTSVSSHRKGLCSCLNP